MTDTNTKVVREFLETANFAVFMNRKFQLHKAEPAGRYSVDILATNMQYSEPDTPLPIRLRAEHMRHIPNAIVDVKGWHSHRFSAALVSRLPELFYFVSPKAVDFARGFFKGAPFKSILVISEESPAEEAWAGTEEILRQKGVDHVLEFPTILNFLISHVEVNVNYIESETLQLLRLLKRYGLVKGLQLELPFKIKVPGLESER
jgi:hypothetical protein